MLATVNTPEAPVAAFFDLDKTILAASSTLALGRTFRERGLVGPQTAARTAYAHAVYLLRGANHIQMERMKAFLAELVAGWEVEVVRAAVASALDTVLMPLVHTEATELIRWHQDNGRDVIIVSSGATEVVGPIGERLGVDDVIATRMQLVDGRYTGVIEFYAYGPTKAEAVRELAGRRGYRLEDCFGYSDSITDLPLLAAVGRPHAVNPDRRLHEHADTHGWPVLEFAPPAAGLPGVLRLSHRLTQASPQALGTASALGALGALGLSAGIGVAVVRRRRRRQ